MRRGHVPRSPGPNRRRRLPSRTRVSGPVRPSSAGSESGRAGPTRCQASRTGSGPRYSRPRTMVGSNSSSSVIRGAGTAGPAGMLRPACGSSMEPGLSTDVCARELEFATERCLAIWLFLVTTATPFTQRHARSRLRSTPAAPTKCRRTPLGYPCPCTENIDRHGIGVTPSILCRPLPAQRISEFRRPGERRSALRVRPAEPSPKAGSSPGSANSGPGSANSGPGSAKSGPGSAKSGTGSAKSGPGSANSGPGSAESGARGLGGRWL